MQDELDTVIQFCNANRAPGKPEIKKMPPGERYRSEKCPVSVATGYTAGSVYLLTQEPKPRMVMYPPEVTRFVSNFDRGMYPDLVVPSDRYGEEDEVV